MSKKYFITAGTVFIACIIAVGVWLYVYTGDGIYIYYFNIQTNQLEAERRGTPVEDPIMLIQETGRMFHLEPRGSNLRRTIPEGLFIEKMNLRGSTLEVFFPEEYHEMLPFDEGLFRASLVQTMTGLPLVENVQIMVNGYELYDPFGRPFGEMNRDNILLSPEIRPQQMVTQTLTLYFVNADLDGLSSEERTVIVDHSLHPAEIILQQLIEGPNPDSEGLLHTIPSGTRIRDVRTEGGMCSINFNEAFVNNFGFPQNLAELTLQSIVHSIKENLSDVRSVQFLIEEERREQFNGVPYFDAPFERDEELLFSGESEET